MEMDVEEVEYEEFSKCACGYICKKDLAKCACGYFCKKDLAGSEYNEVEERSKKAEARCVELELDIQRKENEYNLLETKYNSLEVDKLVIEDELKVLKGQNDELKKFIDSIEGGRKSSSGSVMDKDKIVYWKEENVEEDSLVQLLIENKILECEKNRAESEVEVWKEKFKELESQVLAVNENLVFRCADCPSIGGTKIGLGLQKVNSDEVSEKQEANEGVRTRDGSHDGTNLDTAKIKNLAEVASPIIHSPGKGIGDLQAAGTPFNDLPYGEDARTKEKRKGVYVAYGRRVRKHLSYEEEKSPGKKLAPPTPASSRPASLGIIYISDSDDEQTTHLQLPASDDEIISKVRTSDDCTSALSVESEKKKISGSTLKQLHHDKNDEEDMDASNENLFFMTPKRKRASNIVTSDTESDEHDTVPISKLKQMRLEEKAPDEVHSDVNDCLVTVASLGDNVKGSAIPPRWHLMRLRKHVGKSGGKSNSSSPDSKTKYDQGVPAIEEAEDDQADGVSSESEGESLGGFIVESSDVSDTDDASRESQDASDENMDFAEIISKLQRKKDKKLEWEFEADMLAAFAKDTELCMKAVCALYRQQTSEEKSSKEAFFSNHRGFSKFDAPKGSFLAEFLTGGDPEGDLKKSVKELQEHDPKAVELCRRLATHYSKQLFEIYKNKEDPLFLP